MKNQLAVNRVETDLNQWRSREERLSKLFSFSLSGNKALLREKLHYYERVASRYRGSRDPDERFALQLLRQENRTIERAIYPNRLLRLLRRLVVVPLRQQLTRRRELRNVQENSHSLQQQVQRAGFSGLSSRINEQIKLGQSQFSIPLSYYVNEKQRIDHQLSFSRDQAGRYQFNGFQANLQEENQPDTNKGHYFNSREGWNTHLAYSLLEGRAVLKEGRWIQLDFNDKDADGNYRIKEFHSSLGYDLEKVLQTLPIKEMRESNRTYELLEKLKTGSREAVSFLRDGKEQRYFIEANPQFKSVNIYDEHSRKITIATASGAKTAEALKVSHKVNQQQVQTKRNGMKVLR
jgi:hypothetical protein